jgi:secondary thiamine-phosphate synthase enzyme
MKANSETLEIRTKGKGTYEITAEIHAVVTKSGVTTGTATVFIQHTSASLVIFENADRSARVDLEKYFERLVPEDTDYFTHTSEGPDDSTSHIRGKAGSALNGRPLAGVTIAAVELKKQEGTDSTVAEVQPPTRGSGRTETTLMGRMVPPRGVRETAMAFSDG